ncbi:branched-chain amino acid transport system permease protein [Nocardioides ginsengisegetis]|uniref:Branched-chain amino acid transport system permease protein n=1 Tax=Nocardioides ginsengisegetis TaxID=661491 RepID=A0A7W3PAW2_9ACTN|nr:ABC transporter permease [Nocardioides ginsengisegetis]MBA8804897.1 branched-chain amino acid transport system permease protein [Nocardioides ginsengisegetis]
MSSFFSYTIFGLFSGAAYAIAASGLVLTYTTTRVFNIAHGAFGMVLSFVFWDFSVRQGIPLWLSLILVLFVVAPAIGWFLQRFVVRGLGEGPVSVSLVVTVGMLVFCIGIATYYWPPEARSVAPFMPGHGIQLGDTFVTAHQIITILVAVAVAVGLYVLLTRTRIGTAMRASVDNPELLKLFGGKPDRVAALAWAIGISLAALSGILLVSVVGLDYYALTLLVVNAYAAAMLGRLKSLPMTFVGGMALGLLTSYVAGYLPSEGWLNDLRNVVSPLFLFVVIVAMPQAQLRVGQVKGIVSAPLPSLSKALGWGVGLLVLTALLTGNMSTARLLLLGTAATYAMVMLSLVLLTGYGGHVSLAQFTFAGVGALAYAKLDEPNLAGLVLSALIAAGVGALVALPVLRLTGLYLALSTLAFAVLMDKLVFQAHFAFGYNGSLTARRLSILGTSITSTLGYVLVMTVFLVLMGFFLLFIRRGVLGRVLIAMRDSPAACGTLGLDMRWFRVGLFGLSAGMAGLAGALFAGLRGTIGAADFQFFQSLPLLLLAVVFGVTSVTGATLGGVGLMLLPVLGSDYPSIAGLLLALIGFGAVALARDPNGLANLLFKAGRFLEKRYAPQLLARLPQLPGRGSTVDAGYDADDPDPDAVVDPAREVPAHVAT